ncbi:MAG: hypothetical protein IJY39_08390 [Clostridia bacterium]|nr:hypothetical protein [Clostridia bacterium]
MIYYGLITLATAMFSVMFFFNQLFQKHYGSGLRAALLFSTGSGVAGLIVLLAINGFSFEYTHFSLLMAILTALNGLGFTFCSLKALGKINLSLYSLFSMLGGMALPFVSGILFHNEDLTLGKGICFVIITLALLLTVEKGENKGGTVYYVGIFVLNGMSGVLSKIFTDAPYDKASDTGYSILCAVVAVLLSLILLLIVRPEKKRINAGTVVSMIGNGVLGRVANWILLITLAVLPASAQYPFVTGGTMILSTLLCYFTPNKPRWREIAAVILSFAGLLVLVFVP